MHRRTFLQTAALAPLARAGAPAPFGMTLALAPGSIGVTVPNQRELNALAARHGFESVEPRGTELAGLAAGQLDEAVADLRAKGLQWAAAGLTVDFRKDEATFRDGLGKLPAIAAALRRAGAERVGTWLSPSHAELTYRANFDRHAARLREIARVLGEHGLRLGLEYVGTQLLLVGQRYPFVHTLAETRELIAAIGTGNVGLVLDTWHWWTAGDTAEELRALRAEDVVSVDLNDAPAGVPKALQKDNERELPLATGVIPAAPFIGALRAMGYAGPARCEPFNAKLNALDNDAACAAVVPALRAARALAG